MIWGGILGGTLVNVIGTIDAVKACEKYNLSLREKYDLVYSGNELKLVIKF